jgi:hypothetical protein
MLTAMSWHGERLQELLSAGASCEDAERTSRTEDAESSPQNGEQPLVPDNLASECGTDSAPIKTVGSVDMLIWLVTLSSPQHRIRPLSHVELATIPVC